MPKLSKKRKAALAKYDINKAYQLVDEAKIIKEITNTKFDSSVELNVRLGIDVKQANQMVRGTVSLPHGTGKDIRVLVLCNPDKEEEAKAAGADFVGLDEFITVCRSDLFRLCDRFLIVLGARQCGPADTGHGGQAGGRPTGPAGGSA